MREISNAIRIKMYHPEEKEKILNLEEKTELIKNRKFGIHHHCNAKETESLQKLIDNNQAFVSHFDTHSTIQTSGYDALVVSDNKEYYLVKWKNKI